MKHDDRTIGRRDFLRQGTVLAGGMLLAGAAPGTAALANRHPHPNPGSIDHLDRKMYIHNMTVHGHFSVSENSHRNGLWRTAGKAQMFARGRQRLLFQAGNIHDVTDPLRPEVIAEGVYRGGQVQLCYNGAIKKWILMTGATAPSASATSDKPAGKYHYPEKAEHAVSAPGLRGVRLYDVTDPAAITLLSEWSCDQGDPGREVQTGGGTHRNFYGGGAYAYLDTAPDNTFTHLESPYRRYSNCIQIIDISDPAAPEFVSNWWVEGQRQGEEEAYRKWPEYGDRESWTAVHGPLVPPRMIEDGGKYGYSAYGSFGVLVHDISDPKNPKLVGKFDPKSLPGGIPFHTVDVSRAESRGFVIASPEPLNPDCNEVYHDTWVIDVRDPANPRPISRLPIPKPPDDAPYEHFCNKRGRFGTHNPPFNHAPGSPHPNFTCYSYFNAGVQCYDITRPEAPRISAYFIPPQGGSLDDFASFDRDTDNMFVEWDRRLIWALTSTGIYLLSTPALGQPVLEPMAVQDWALPGLNVGHDG